MLLWEWIFLKKHGIPDLIVNCVAEHHEDKPFSSIESVIVHIADQISGARPGARYEDVENYGKRLGRNGRNCQKI